MIRHETYPIDLLERRHWWLLDLLQITPVGISIITLPLSIFALLQHGTEVHATWIWHIQLTFGWVFAMDVRYNNTISAFIVRFYFTNAQDDRICATIGDELVATTFNNFTNTFVELKCGCWISFNLNCDVPGCIYKMNIISWNFEIEKSNTGSSNEMLFAFKDWRC